MLIETLSFVLHIPNLCLYGMEMYKNKMIAVFSEYRGIWRGV